jgi:ubiquinone biosynthesis UbiH/UbiF/VisC/COQ6 family hydroxylase
MLQYSTAIREIHVSQRGEFGTVHLSAQEHGWEAMGYVVENAELGKTLFAALRNYPAIEFIGGANVAAIKPAAESNDVVVEKNKQLTTLSAKLVVIADGANSALCQSLGIAAQRHDYAQCGLIANVAFSKPHNGCAYERFTDWGPMALLPLAEQQGMHRAALIWTFDHERGEQLKAVEEKQFLAVLQQRFGYRQGRFLRVGERHIYPLLLNAATEQVRQRLVVLGNAAHTLHPVAGQGFNLSLRDVASLADTLSEAREKNQSPFELSVLQGYLRRRHFDQQNTIGFSHQLTRIFSSDNSLVQCGRRFGLLALDSLPAMKSLFTDYAAGTAAWDSP